MSNDKPKQAPTHEIFAVETGSNGKAYWTKIGAAWPHEDGKGFSLKLAFLPVAGQAINLRTVEPKAGE